MGSAFLMGGLDVSLLSLMNRLKEVMQQPAVFGEIWL